MTEQMTFEQLLQSLDVDLLPERCPLCHTQHPRYLLRLAEEGKTDFVESPGFIRSILAVQDDGKEQLALLIEFDGKHLRDPDNHQSYGTLIDRTVEKPYDCEERKEKMRLAYLEAMGRTDKALVRRMKRVLAMLSPGYDWQRHWRKKNPADLEDELRACCRLEYVNGKTREDEEREDRMPQRACGSASVADTPRSLYRLLYLFRPASLSFQDMYKGCLLVISTPDGRFSVAVHFFKYELGLYYSAEAALVHDDQEGQWMHVRAGAPDADNGLFIQHEEGLLFFHMIRAALARTWTVYGGNEFEV